jgi:hypothetical protein
MAMVYPAGRVAEVWISTLLQKPPVDGLSRSEPPPTQRVAALRGGDRWVSSRRAFRSNAILVYLKDGNKTVVYLEFIYTLKIDQNVCQNSIRSHLGQMLAAMRFLNCVRPSNCHTAGYEEIFCRMLTTFPLPYPWETPYVRTVLPTVGSRDHSLPGYSINPFGVCCVG